MNHFITLATQVSEINPALAHLGEYLFSQGIDEETLRTATLVTEELLLNIISHGYQDKGQADLEMEIQIELDRVGLTFRDGAFHFDPHEAPGEPGPQSGWGLPLVKSLCMNSRYKRANGQNEFYVEIERA